MSRRRAPARPRDGRGSRTHGSSRTPRARQAAYPECRAASSTALTDRPGGNISFPSDKGAKKRGRCPGVEHQRDPGTEGVAACTDLATSHKLQAASCKLQAASCKSLTHEKAGCLVPILMNHLALQRRRCPVVERQRDPVHGKGGTNSVRLPRARI